MVRLNKGQRASIVYHRLFGYGLSAIELEKWEMAPQPAAQVSNIEYRISNIDKNQRQKISEKKLRLAKKAAGLLGKIPTVRMVAVTGALAMKNATSESDIDLMIITRADSLWLTRALTYFVLRITGFEIRVPRDKNQKDKLCLNIWLDETALVWPKSDRNLYTSHEIAQIVPLVNKNQTYERFLVANDWIQNFWPFAVKPQDTKILKYKDTRERNLISNIGYRISSVVENLAFQLQYAHMKSKITREVITPHKALFHPIDWAEKIYGILQS